MYLRESGVIVIFGMICQLVYCVFSVATYITVVYGLSVFETHIDLGIVSSLVKFQLGSDLSWRFTLAVWIGFPTVSFSLI